MTCVVWINGPFSAGKTTVADALVDLLPGSFVLDPEEIGTLVRRIVPQELQAADYQDSAIWRVLTRESIATAAREHARPVIVPMTVIEHFAEVVGWLRSRLRLEHFTLLASPETLEARHSTRWDATEWARQQWPRCLQLADDRYARHVLTDGREPREIAGELAQQVRTQ
jgi:chloramphenicol 3-O-phosphotransferase